MRGKHTMIRAPVVSRRHLAGAIAGLALAAPAVRTRAADPIRRGSPPRTRCRTRPIACRNTSPPISRSALAASTLDGPIGRSLFTNMEAKGSVGACTDGSAFAHHGALRCGADIGPAVVGLHPVVRQAGQAACPDGAGSRRAGRYSESAGLCRGMVPVHPRRKSASGCIHVKSAGPEQIVPYRNKMPINRTPGSGNSPDPRCRQIRRHRRRRCARRRTRQGRCRTAPGQFELTIGLMRCIPPRSWRRNLSHGGALAPLCPGR